MIEVVIQKYAAGDLLVIDDEGERLGIVYDDFAAPRVMFHRRHARRIAAALLKLAPSEQETRAMDEEWERAK